MFARARVHVVKSLAPQEWNDGQFIVPAQDLPQTYTLEQIRVELTDSNDLSFDEDVSNLVILKSCLQYPKRIVKDTSDSTAVNRLLSWTSRTIVPDGNIANQSEDESEHGVGSNNMGLDRSKYKSQIGMECLQLLLLQKSDEKDEILEDVLLKVLIFTDLDDPWNSETSYKAACQILSRFDSRLICQEFIIGTVLDSFIRPLFSKSRPAGVTSRGRKAINSDNVDSHTNDLDRSKRPWKYEAPWAVTLYQWAVRHANETMIRESWHLFIPPLLTLIDDTAVAFKIRGLKTLYDLLGKTPSGILRATGLGAVFEEATMPILLYLPNVTPVEESLPLLDAAYNALFRLADLRFPQNEGNNERLKFYDRIMRRGILLGFFQTGENVRIMELLFLEMYALITRMGIHSAKHLKDIIPILSNLLTDPFALLNPTVLLAALEATRATILTCWPRMSEPTHRVELIKALSICWLAVKKEETSPGDNESTYLSTIKDSLVNTGNTLKKSTDQLDVGDEIKSITSIEPSLVELFGPI